MQAAEKLEKASTLRMHIKKRKMHGNLAMIVQRQEKKTIPKKQEHPRKK
jgi:hypothetical protein